MGIGISKKACSIIEVFVVTTIIKRIIMTRANDNNSTITVIIIIMIMIMIIIIITIIITVTITTKIIILIVIGNNKIIIRNC